MPVLLVECDELREARLPMRGFFGDPGEADALEPRDLREAEAAELVRKALPPDPIGEGGIIGPAGGDVGVPMLAVELGELCKVVIPRGRATPPARRRVPLETKGIEPCLPLGIDGVPAILEELVMHPMAKSGIGLVREGHAGVAVLLLESCQLGKAVVPSPLDVEELGLPAETDLVEPCLPIRTQGAFVVVAALSDHPFGEQPVLFPGGGDVAVAMVVFVNEKLGEHAVPLGLTLLGHGDRHAAGSHPFEPDGIEQCLALGCERAVAELHALLIPPAKEAGRVLVALRDIEMAVLLLEIEQLGKALLPAPVRVRPVGLRLPVVPFNSQTFKREPPFGWEAAFPEMLALLSEPGAQLRILPAMKRNEAMAVRGLVLPELAKQAHPPRISDSLGRQRGFQCHVR